MKTRQIFLSFHVLISTLSVLIPSTLAFNRTIGPPNDGRFIAASRACNGSDPANFKFAVCSLLIACVYDKLDEAFKASLSSGTNIASLLPTILVLIGVLRILLHLWTHCIS